MESEIYYFSGTGNSLVVAKDIAKMLDGCLIPMSSVFEQETVEPQSNVVGIVFPVFYATNDCGIPLIVENFVKKLINVGSKYIFAVCTHNGMPGTTIENLRSAIEARGGKLADGFIVRMRSKNLPSRKQEEMRIKRMGKAKIICQYVKAQKKGKYETRGLLRKILLTPLHEFEKPIFMHRYRKLSNASRKSFKELVPLADASFRINENCTGCGICARICPVNNINMIDGKPKWLHHCETCYGCYGWCPNNAICGDIVSYNEWYHHPEIELAEMFRVNDVQSKRRPLRL